VTVSPTSTTYGTSVTYTATVTSGAGAPTGSVTFTTSSGVVTLCTATLSGGTGSCTATNAPLGTDTITGGYPATGNFAASSGTTTLTVNAIPTSVTLSSSANPSPSGSPVTFTATVSPAGVTGPNEGVTFYDNGVVIGCEGVNSSVYTESAPLPGCNASSTTNVATFTTSTLPLGTNDIVAAFYGGGGPYAFSDTSLTQVVNLAPGYAYTLSGLPDGIFLLSASSSTGCGLLGTSPCSSSSSGVAIVVDITGQYVSASNDTLSVAVYENGTQIATVTPTSFAPILLPVTS